MEKIRATDGNPYRLSEDEIDDGECRNCGRMFVFRQDGRDHVCPVPRKTAPVIGLRVLRADIDRRWTCEVLRSGYHNGATCNPREPHSGWNCGYRNECFISLTDEQMEDWA